MIVLSEKRTFASKYRIRFQDTFNEHHNLDRATCLEETSECQYDDESILYKYTIDVSNSFEIFMNVQEISINFATLHFNNFSFKEIGMRLLLSLKKRFLQIKIIKYIILRAYNSTDFLTQRFPP